MQCIPVVVLGFFPSDWVMQPKVTSAITSLQLCSILELDSISLNRLSEKSRDLCQMSVEWVGSFIWRFIIVVNHVY